MPEREPSVLRHPPASTIGRRLSDTHCFTLSETARKMRNVVPSSKGRSSTEIESLDSLQDASCFAICAGPFPIRNSLRPESYGICITPGPDKLCVACNFSDLLLP